MLPYRDKSHPCDLIAALRIHAPLFGSKITTLRSVETLLIDEFHALRETMLKDLLL